MLYCKSFQLPANYHSMAVEALRVEFFRNRCEDRERIVKPAGNEAEAIKSGTPEKGNFDETLKIK